ncbi:MAG: hypothetical protein Kow0077_29030 [Anaerolineae bacterium]
MTVTTADLRNFIDAEYNAQVKQVRAMWEQPLPTRIAEGEAVGPLSIVANGGGTLRLRCGVNLSKFREGDLLVLHRGDPTAHPHYECTLETDNGTELVIRAGFRESFWDIDTVDGWLLDRGYADLRHILMGAITELEAPHAEPIRALLAGTMRAEFAPARVQAGMQRAIRLGFNASQQRAFAQAYAARNFALIQGPPGTGKTLVLAHLAAALAAEGQRVLVTAFTHRAINNALRKIGKETGYRPVMKIGQRDRADDLAWDGGAVPNFERFGDCPYGKNQSGLIIGGTCFAVRTSRLQEVEFDTVIFDEASQVTLPLAVAGMLAGRRYIFIGDHQQMPPVIVGEHANPAVTRSIFETLFTREPGTMLDTTYRMNAAINVFPSRAFYGGRLRPDRRAAGRRLQLNGVPAGALAHILDPAHPEVFVAVKHTRRTLRSPEEAELAAALTVEALRCGVPAREIAVVAPYRAQGRQIRAMLHEALSGQPDALEEIVVDTVERIQGQERDVIIISLTTSDPAHAAERADFYFRPNRLNVALTRPRVKRIVLGSPSLLKARPDDPEHSAWVKLFRALYENSTVIPYPLR